MNPKLCRSMKSVLSLILAIVMVLGIIPPIEVSAATAASISSLKLTPSTAYEGDSVGVSGTVKSGSYYLRAIQIDVRRYGDDSHGFTADRVDFKFADKKTSYSLSNLDEFDIGSYRCTGDGNTEYLDAGTHKVYVYVGLYDANGNTAEGLEKVLTLTVKEEELFDVSEDYLEFEADGGSDTFKITADSSYTISESLSWITLSSTSGSSSKTITVTCKANTSTSDRDGTITVKHESSGATLKIDVYQEGVPAGEVTSISPSSTSVNTMTSVTFTINTNKQASYGVEIYADDTYLGTVTSKTTYSSYYKYTYSHQFKSSGTKKIYAYPIDEDGYIDESNGDYCTITVNAPNGTLNTPVITTANNQTIEDGSSFTVSWNKPTNAPSSGTKYNVYVLSPSGDNEVVKGNTTSTSYTIPASAFDAAVGSTYVVSVIAFAPGYKQSNDATINVTVAEVVEGEVLSVTPSTTSVNTMTSVTFTINTNKQASYGVEIYADDSYLGSVTSKTTYSTYYKYTYTHQFKSSGARTVYAYPIDEDGYVDKSNGAYCTITVNAPNGILNLPVITTQNNQAIEDGSSFTVSWNKPTNAPSSGTKYNVFLLKPSGENKLMKENTTSTSYTIPASAFDAAVGSTYVVSVIAFAPGYKQSNDATINVTVAETGTLSTGILGDVNSDGNVNDIDQFILKRYLDKISGYTVDTIAADINGNGQVTSDDLTILNNYLVSNNGYENLYDFCNRAGSSNKPSVSGVNQIYYINKGESLTIPFTLTAKNGGKIEKVTMKHNMVGTTFKAQSYECNVASYSNSFSISGYPLNEVGSHTFVIYCRASNYTVTNNEIIIFTVYVTEKECNHANYDDQYLRTVYSGNIKTTVEHTYYHEYKSICEDCGITIGNVVGDIVTEGHKLNTKGYCSCGYISRSGYAAWEGYNSSGKTVTVYSNPESTGSYGSIYSNEIVSVLGECCGRYLIEYKLDGGGIKQGYVQKNTISKTNVSVGLYSLYVQSRYFYEDLNGLSEHGLIANPGDYFAVKVYDNTQKKYVSIASDSKLSWKCRDGSATIDKYGTLCVKDSHDCLELFYDGKLVSSIEIASLRNLSGYLQTHDSITQNWSDKNMSPNNHYIIKDFESTYNKTAKCYDVTMTVYNHSVLVYGVVAYDSTGQLYDIDYVESYWTNFSYVGEVVNAFKYVPDIFNGSMLHGTSGAVARETKIEVSVPLGGYIEFLYPTENDMLMNANIIQIVFAVLDMGLNAFELKGNLSEVSDIISNKAFIDICADVFEEYGITKFTQEFILNTNEQDGAKLLRDYMTAFTDATNEGLLEDIEKALMECFKGTSAAEGFMAVGDSFIETKIPLAMVISKGVNIAGDAIQMASAIISMRNMYNNASSAGHLIIYYPTSPAGSGGHPF